MSFFNIFRNKFPANCGHDTFAKDELVSFDEIIKNFELVVYKGKTRYCHQCIAGMSIKCSCCQRVIFINDPVKTNPEGVVVGCAKCREIGIVDCNGIWVIPGTVAKLTSIELANTYMR